jgi:hypothetical protein
MSITTYQHKQIQGFPGAVDGPIDHEFTRTRTNKMLAQAGTLTVGGTADDGIYSVTITNPADPEHPITVEFDRQDSETNNQIAAALAALLVKALMLKATVTVLNAVITVTFKNSNITYTVETADPGTGTLTWAQTQAAGGSSVPFGRFVRGGGDGVSFRPLVTGSVIADVIGVVVRELTVQNPETGIPPGREGAILGVGPILVLTEEDVTPADTVYIRKETSANGTEVGVVRKSADGGTAISAATVCKFDSTSAAGTVARVIVNIPLQAA